MIIPTIQKIAVVAFAITLIACGSDGGQSTNTKPEVKPDPKPEVKPDPEPEVKPDPEPEPEVKPEVTVSELASLPEKSLEYYYATNQQIVVDAYDNIYLRRNDLYKQEINRNETAGNLYILKSKANNWEKAEFDLPISTPNAIYPWGVGNMFAPLYEGSGNKVYILQLYKICSAPLDSLKFSCTKIDSIALGKTTGLETLSSVEPDVNYYTSNDTFNSISVSKGDKNYWIVGQDNGDIEETYDFGKTFTKLRSYAGGFEQDAFEYRVRKINYVPEYPNIYYAATAEGLLKSQDTGKTWDLVSKGKKDSVSVSNDGKFIIAVEDRSNNSALTYSNDSGKTWKTVNNEKFTAYNGGITGSDSSKQVNGIFYLFDKNKAYKVQIGE